MAIRKTMDVHAINMSGFTFRALDICCAWTRPVFRRRASAGELIYSEAQQVSRS
jgi:hypothetical protein